MEMFWMYFAAVTLVWCHVISSTTGQLTVNIDVPKGDTPNEGELSYELICNVGNFGTYQYRTLVWFLNGEIVAWSGDIILEYAEGHMTTAQRYSHDGQLLASYLTIDTIRLTDTGKYQCSIVEGEQTNYRVKVSAAVSVIINDMMHSDLYYHPPEPWPICYPKVVTTVPLNSEYKIGCFTEKGNPSVNINLYVTGIYGDTPIPPGENLVDRDFAYEKEFTLIISPLHDSISYLCIIQRPGFMDSSMCEMGQLKVGLIEPTVAKAPIGAFAIFHCRKPQGATIIWSTEPNISSSRIEEIDDSTLSSIKIYNLQIEESNTIVTCRTDRYNLVDSGKIIVFDQSINIETTKPWKGYTTMTDEDGDIFGYGSKPTTETSSESNVTMVNSSKIKSNISSIIGATVSVLILIFIATTIIYLRYRNQLRTFCCTTEEAKKSTQEQSTQTGEPEYQNQIIQGSNENHSYESHLPHQENANHIMTPSYETNIVQNNSTEEFGIPLGQGQSTLMGRPTYENQKNQGCNKDSYESHLPHQGNANHTITPSNETNIVQNSPTEEFGTSLGLADGQYMDLDSSEVSRSDYASLH